MNQSNSLSIFDTTSETYTGGEIIDEYFVPIDGGLYLDFKGKEIEMFQGEVLVISAESSLANTVDFSITFLEDQ